MGPTNDFAKFSQYPTLKGLYAYPFQDMSYAPPSIEWSYEAPSDCSYGPPPPPPEVQPLEDVITKFIHSQNDRTKSNRQVRTTGPDGFNLPYDTRGRHP